MRPLTESERADLRRLLVWAGDMRAANAGGPLPLDRLRELLQAIPSGEEEGSEPWTSEIQFLRNEVGVAMQERFRAEERLKDRINDTYQVIGDLRRDHDERLDMICERIGNLEERFREHEALDIHDRTTEPEEES